MSTYGILPRPPYRRNDLQVDIHELYAYLHRMLVPAIDQTYQTIPLTLTGGGSHDTQFVLQGKQLTLWVPTFSVASSSTTLSLTGLPLVFSPINELTQNVVVQMSGLIQLGAMYIAAGGTTIQYAPAHLNTTGWNNDGLLKGVFSYYVQWIVA